MSTTVHDAKVTQWLSNLRASYGFVPAVMSVGAAFLALLLLKLPSSWGPDLSQFLGLPPIPDITHMRSLLVLIASTTIGTGAVAFSVVCAASISAATSYGPRLLTNFLSDRGTQACLGFFVASFVYCIIVYASLREGDDGYGLAGLGAMAWAFSSVGALIYYLHHAPASLRINQTMADIGRTLIDNIPSRFAANCGYAVPDGKREAARQKYETRQD
ncbi:MAG: DUF2254 family protein, partial [Pacificimonas sp.]